MNQDIPQSGLKYVDPSQGKEFWVHHLHRYQDDELAALRARLSKENETLSLLIRRFNLELDRGVSIENAVAKYRNVLRAVYPPRRDEKTKRRHLSRQRSRFLQANNWT